MEHLTFKNVCGVIIMVSAIIKLIGSHITSDKAESQRLGIYGTVDLIFAYMLLN